MPEAFALAVPCVRTLFLTPPCWLLSMPMSLPQRASLTTLPEWLLCHPATPQHIILHF